MIEATVNVPGYRILEQIYIGTKTLVYQGISEADQKCVILKLMRSEYPSFSEIVQFRNQYAIAKNLDLDGIAKPYSLETYRNGYALVMEFGGISLREWGIETPRRDVCTFLDIGIQIAQILDALHRAKVIHKDIKPANILINSHQQVKLIDFSIASLLPKETQQLQNPNVLEGTLAYISPEQTGRMNRGIDYRTDFYSLGVTFFELLTGQLPFSSDDPMELIHSHIAKLPPLVHSINPAIPSVMSDIIAKLMAKNAEDRYQSAKGLKYDLEVCLHTLKATGKIANFELGIRDISERFLIPEKLYGRQAEVKALLDAFARVVAKSKIEMMLVAGFSGIGKTAVINEVHKPIVAARGYFIKGKYDQFQRNIPFSAFVQAFRDLIGQLLSESDAQLQQWKIKILEAVGENGQVIIDVIPELERIIGRQPPVTELIGSAVQNRFNLLFQKFIQVFTTDEHPLVIFLDDLQWADSASLKLMQLLMIQSDTGYLLLIGAYRDNEVSTTHPLMLTLGEIRSSGATINTITLSPLLKADLNHLVTDTLNCSEELALPLTELVHQKTKGNPFFSNQFLKSLYEDGLITFNFEVRYWQCDIAKVNALALTDDVVEFIALQLVKLPQETQEVLKLAACIGNQFDLATLAIISENSQAEIAADLWKALQEGLVLPTSEIYKFFQKESVNSQEKLAISNEQLAINYRFLHDRIQQAAYALIPENKKQLTHLKIGQLLLKHTKETETEEKIFDIVNHLNVGAELITQEAERHQLARLNLTAGRKAKASTAYAAAVGYLALGRQIIAPESWREYDLTLALHEEAAEAAYLSGDFEQMELLAQVVLQTAKTLLDKVKVYEIKIQAGIAQNQPVEAVKTALTVLELLGIRFPLQPSKARVLFNLLETKLVLRGKSIESLCNLPEMSSSTGLIVTRLLSKAVSAAYIGKPELLPLLVFKNINLFVKYGNTHLSAFAYAWYGLILCGVVVDIKSGYEFGELALNLLSIFNAKEIKARVNFIVYCFIKHWQVHVRETLPFLIESYQSGLDSGDIEYAAWSSHVYCQHSYFAGDELTALEQNIYFYSDAIAKAKQETALNYNNIFRQVVLNLLGNSENLCILNGEAFKESEIIPLQKAANDQTGLFLLYLNKAFLSYLFYKHQQASETIQLAEKYLEGGTALLGFAIFYFYDSLISLAVYAQADNAYRRRLLRRVASNQKKLKKWAFHAPTNHLHKYHLVQAEWCRVLGQTVEAQKNYDDAIALAKENEYLNEEAIAYELAAHFYLEWGREKIAQVYLIDAYYAYARWGAKAKVDDLEKHYPQLLTPILQRQKDYAQTTSSDLSTSFSTHNTIQNTVSNSISISEALDLATILKTSQAISSEIQLEQLLSTLMQVVLENAGAQKGALILMKENNLVIAAQARLGEAEIAEHPVEESQEIPTTLIYYVKNTLSSIVFKDATAVENLASDPYIQLQQPKSVLCTPILNQGKLVGILYLENNLTLGAFTNSRIEILNLLCSQAAISLENARLYQQAQQTLEDLKEAQLQLVQSEKMSALGNLVAGVAHEINNPVCFIAGNLQPALNYVQDLFDVIDLYQQKFSNPGVEILTEIQAIDLEYIREDLPKLISSMQQGVDRICSISDSLRTFSRADTDSKIAFNIHDGIDSTILILKHRLKASNTRPAMVVEKNYGNLPLINCFPGQLNQVFMNLLANAIDALEESNVGRSFKDIQINPNRITITTSISADHKQAVIRIADNGVGMLEKIHKKIFDHLFTTKSVGKGTGLGLAIVRQIVVEKHGGTIKVNSTPGRGSEFVIAIPL